MLKYKKILLSLSLCLILLTGSVFATNMSKSEIVDYFDDNVSSDIYVSEYVIGNFSDILDGINSYISDYSEEFDSDYTLSNNYFCYYYNDDENYYDYYDLGNSKITSCSYNDHTFTLYLDNGAQRFKGYSEEDNCFSSSHVNNIEVAIIYPLSSNQFEDLFIYSSNNIFTDNSSNNGVIAFLGLVLGAILNMFPIIFTAIWSIDIFKFIILCSIALGVIYFVVILIKSYVGMNNLSIRFLGNYEGHKPTLKDGYYHYVNSHRK